MRIKDHLRKITWSFIDKGNYLLFGLFTLYQWKYLEPSDYAFFQSMVYFNNWIFLLADGFALNGLIQFGGDKKNKAQVNFLSLATLVIFSLSMSFAIYLFRGSLGEIFNDESFIISLKFLPFIALLTISRNFALKLLTRELKFFNIFVLNLAFFGTQVVTTLWILTFQDSLDFRDMIKILTYGGIVSTIFAVVLSFKYLKFSYQGSLSPKKFFKFGFIVSQQQIFHSMPKIFDFYIVQFFFGAEKAGIYAAAKTLYKTFDEAASAAHSLIYPSSVKLIFQKNWDGFKSLTNKSLSALIFVFGFLALILNLGLTEYVVSFFQIEKYYQAIGLFNLLVLGGIFLPFALLTSLLNALSKENIVLRNKVIATIISLMSLYIISNSGNFHLTSLTIVIYNFVLGILCYSFLKNRFELNLKDLFRFITDGINFIKK